MNNREWLVWLNGEIWEELTDPVSCLPWAKEKRKLTQTEFDRLKNIAQSHEFVVEPHNGNMGFGFALTFHELPNYPGLEARPIFSVNSTHLPEYSGGPSFEAGWNTLSPFSHNLENERLLKFHGFPGLREKHSYDY